MVRKSKFDFYVKPVSCVSINGSHEFRPLDLDLLRAITSQTGRFAVVDPSKQCRDHGGIVKGHPVLEYKPLDV